MNWQAVFPPLLNLINRFLPKSHRASVVGFDIGSFSIKALEMGPGGEIHRWVLEPFDGTDILSALKRVVSVMKMTDQIPVASVSGKGTLIRYIDMPRMTLEELRKSFVYEIDKYFPFDPQTIYTDCYIIDPQSKEKKMSVVVAAAKKELVDDRIKLFKEVGMELTHVISNSVAMANAFNHLGASESTTGARAILDIGGSLSSLIILDQGHFPSFTRDIFIGAHEMSKQIANILGIDISQAEELKRSPAARSEEILQACEIPLGNLVEETQLSFDYFATEKNSSVGELFLAGGGAHLKGIEGVFEKSLNISVKVWNPLADLHLGSEATSPDIHLFSSQLGVALGLALTKV